MTTLMTTRIWVMIIDHHRNDRSDMTNEDQSKFIISPTITTTIIIILAIWVISGSRAGWNSDMQDATAVAEQYRDQ